MDDLRKFFPNTKLNTEELRETIKKITQMTDEGFFFCYKCFKYLGTIPTDPNCKYCYQFYCKKCADNFYNSGNTEICRYKCLQCVETAIYDR